MLDMDLLLVESNSQYENLMITSVEYYIKKFVSLLLSKWYHWYLNINSSRVIEKIICTRKNKKAHDKYNLQ